MKKLRLYINRCNRKCGAWVAMLMLLLLVACARMGTPDGGFYDEEPPRITHTSPAYGSTNTKSKKVVLTFNENIKIEGASEKVVVSPPQMEQPEIDASNKKITVTLQDTLKPNVTYTIDFSDAIQDNNEGNPMGQYAFTFSTGEHIDTMQISGTVLDASNLEPIKGMLVGLYRIPDDEDSVVTDSVITDSIALDSLANDTLIIDSLANDSLEIKSLANDTLVIDSLTNDTLVIDSAEINPYAADTVFQTRPLERIARTNGSGKFIVKGLARGAKYRVFALQDQDQTYTYSQKSEMLAFSSRVITPNCFPDTRIDTIWHDSIHYDSLVTVPYTHFTPDDVVLLAFTSGAADRYLLKSERPDLYHFSLYFTAPSDTLPCVTPLNFDADYQFIVDASEKNDTLHYWMRDSLVYNLDTLELKLDYYATDTTGLLALRTDTLLLVSKITKEKLEKQRKDRWEQWVKDYRAKKKAERKRAEREAEKARKEAEEAGVAIKEEDTEVPTAEEQPPLQDSLISDTLEVLQDSLIADTQIVLQDSLITDTLDVLQDSLVTDNSKIVQEPDSEPEKEEVTGKKGKKKAKKKKNEEIPESEVPPLPADIYELKITGGSGLAPDQNIEITLPEPLDSICDSMIHFSLKVDSLFEPQRFILRQIPGNIMKYRLYAEWIPDSTYQLEIDSAAFVSVYGKVNEMIKKSIRVRSLDDYTTLFVNVNGADTSAIIQLLNQSDAPVKSVKVKKGKADFYFVTPGTYYMRLFYDRNNNGVWDTGDYPTRTQPEEVYYYPNAMQLKAKWEITQDWAVLRTPVDKQKPEKITKQKADKEKTIRNRNAEKRAEMEKRKRKK